MQSLARAVILVGVVTLISFQGYGAGKPGRVLAAEADRAAVDAAVAANSDFAVNLYKELAKEKANQGENLFFSPYSMYAALAMAAEGARGETAGEMGKMLCFPNTARRVGDDAKLVPWNVEFMHKGMAGLNSRFNRQKGSDDPKVRERIESLRKQLKEARARLENGQGWGPMMPGPGREPEGVAEVNRLVKELNKLLPPYELNVVNALWAEKTYPFRQSYLDTIGKYYVEGGAFPVDFRNQPDPTRRQINAWVEKQTHDRIKDLIPPDDIDTLTRLVLTNAVYFKGEWADVFPREWTREDDFLLADGSRTRVSMMQNSRCSCGYAAFKGDGALFDTPQEVESDQQASPRNYPDGNGFTMLEIPYKGNDLAMVVVLPRAADRLPALEKMLATANLQNWIGKLQKRSVNVFMPKFRLETDYRMNETLKAMGMVRAFVVPTSASSGADFTGMCAPTLDRELYVKAVLHKAFVEVDEKGTEAAAATGLMGGGMWQPPKIPFVPWFRADKPFLFLIRNKHTGCTLFLGRVTKPNSAVEMGSSGPVGMPPNGTEMMPPGTMWPGTMPPGPGSGYPGMRPGSRAAGSGRSTIGPGRNTEGDPSSENLVLTTADGLQLAMSYYPGSKGKQSVPIVLLHGWKQTRAEYGRLAMLLQAQGHAVLVPDLRGHGRSTRIKGTDKTVEAGRPSASLSGKMATEDMKAIKDFLWQRNNAGELNIDKLCVVGSEMGAALALHFAVGDAVEQDRNNVPRPAYKVGRFVKALVLISPPWSFPGLSLLPAARHPAVERDISLLILVGAKDPKALDAAKRLYGLVEKYHTNRGDDSQRSLMLAKLDTNLQGAHLLDPGLTFGKPPDQVEVTRLIAEFIDRRLVKSDEAREWGWMERKHPHE